MRLLVTGGCGFIGTNFIYHVLEVLPDVIVHNLDKLTYAGNLNNLAEVKKKHSSRYFFHHADIADETSIKRILLENKIDAIVNFAAESHVDRSIADSAPFILTNVLGTHVLLNVASTCNISRFVHVSTDEVYGSLGATGYFTESTPLAPNSPYSASKASADFLCRAWYETYDFPVVVTRCSNNYGPYQFPEKLIPLMFLRAMNNDSLPVYGDGLNVRDWIYVTDHCRGVLLALLHGVGGRVYNLGGNAEKNNLEVVHAILEYCGKDSSLINFVADRPGHDRRYAMDYTLAERELGFSPQYSFADGIKKTLDWYSQHPQWLEEILSGAYRQFFEQWYKDRV